MMAVSAGSAARRPKNRARVAASRPAVGSSRIRSRGVRAKATPISSFWPGRTWRSPRTNAIYPVAQRIRVDDRTFETRPLMNDQELDSRASTGSVYWEGASTLLEGGRATGRGYLEMTGYVAPMKL